MDSGYLLPDEEFSLTLTRSGAYDYFCIPHEHAGMVGRIVVAAEGEAVSAPTGPSPSRSSRTRSRRLRRSFDKVASFGKIRYLANSKQISKPLSSCPGLTLGIHSVMGEVVLGGCGMDCRVKTATTTRVGAWLVTHSSANTGN